MKLPKKFLGIDTKEALKKYLERAQKNDENGKGEGSSQDQSLKGQGQSLKGIVNGEEYIQVPGVKGIYGNPVVISKFEVQGMNGRNYEDTHMAVFHLGKKLYIPTPAIFMPHFRNVINTYQNRQPLFDAEGNQIRKEEHEEIYKHLTTNFKNIYGGNNPGAWTWLNAGFVQGSGFNNLDLETIIGVNADGTFKTRTEPLIQCLDGNSIYADLIFNSQGFPTQESYRQGENIHYWKPVNGKVARFNANSCRVYLYCCRDSDYSDSALGVFLCAEGVPKK